MSISFQREFLRDLRVLSHSLLASQSRCDSVPHNLEGYQGLSAISPALGLAHILKLLEFLVPFSQFTRSVMSDSLQPHGLQHARLPCPSPTPRACPLMSIELVMPSNHPTLCHLLLLLPSHLSQHQGLFQGVSSSHQVAKE